MTITRLILIVESPLTPRDYARFGLATLQASGLAVEVWEVDAIYLPRPLPEAIIRSADCRLRRFTSESALVHAVKGLGADTCVITLAGPYLGQTWTHAPLLDAFACNACTWATFTSGHRPPVGAAIGEQSAAAQVLDRIRVRITVASSALRSPARVRLLGRRVRARAAQASLPVGSPGQFRPLDLVWAGTSTENIEPRLIGPDTQVRFIHTLDYEELMRTSLEHAPRDIPALYIDTMGPLHPDFAVSDVPVVVDPDSWFSTVRTALDDFEQSTGRTVMIAAHPRASSDQVNRWYGGRAITPLTTAAAIARSELLLVTSASTSLGIAAALRTPAIALRTPAIHASHLWQLDDYADRLGLAMHDATDLSAPWPQPTLDDERYERFVHEFMKLPDTPAEPFWEVVARDIGQV